MEQPIEDADYQQATGRKPLTPEKLDERLSAIDSLEEDYKEAFALRSYCIMFDMVDTLLKKNRIGGNLSALYRKCQTVGRLMLFINQ